MSGISSSASGGPCNYQGNSVAIEDEDDDNDFVNPLEYFFEEIAPPYVDSPKAQRYPEVPLRTTDWDISQGTKPAIKSTLVPFPFPGTGPAMLVDQPIPKGTEGKNTAILISIDRSGSMGGNAFPVQGRSLSRIEVARGIVCALIRLAQNQGDHFAVLSWGSGVYTEWPQSPPGNLDSWAMPLSTNYDEALDYFKQYESGGNCPYPPIPCTDGTTFQFATQALVDKIRGTGMESVISFVVTDAFADYGSNGARNMFSGFFSPDQATGIPMDTMLRRGDSAVYYFGIDNLGNAPTCRRTAEQLNQMIDDHYGKPQRPKSAHFFPLDPANPNAAREMAELMLELAEHD